MATFPSDSSIAIYHSATSLMVRAAIASMISKCGRESASIAIERPEQHMCVETAGRASSLHVFVPFGTEFIKIVSDPDLPRHRSV